MNIFRIVLISLAFMLPAAAFVQTAHAAPCAVNTDTTAVCPAFSVCLKWPTPTTREVVAGEPAVALAAAEIKGYKLKLDSLTFPINNVTNFTYTVPANAVLPTTAVWSIATVDIDGRESTQPYTCTQPVAVAGPKSSPAAPSGLTTTTGK